MRLLIALSALYVCVAEIRVGRPKFETGYGVMTMFSDPDCTVPQAQQIYAIGGCEANEDGSSRKVESIEQSTISSVWNINMGLYSDKFCSVYVGETALPLNKECTDGTRFAYQSEFNPAFHGIVLKSYGSTDNCLNHGPFTSASLYIDHSTTCSAHQSSTPEQFFVCSETGSGKALGKAFGVGMYANQSACGDFMMGAASSFLECDGTSSFTGLFGEPVTNARLDCNLPNDVAFELVPLPTTTNPTDGFLTRGHFDPQQDFACTRSAWNEVYSLGKCVSRLINVNESEPIALSFILSDYTASNTSTITFAVTAFDGVNCEGSEVSAEEVVALEIGAVSSMSCATNGQCVVEIHDSECDAENTQWSFSATAPKVKKYDIEHRYFATAADCAADDDEDLVYTSYFHSYSCLSSGPSSSSSIEGCQRDSYVVASYEDETCGTEVRRFSQPLYECAFSADYGYVRTSCSYADTGSNSDIPHDAIYSLLLLLLLVPPIMYIVAMAMGGAAAGGAGSASAAGSKQGQTAVPKEEVEEPAEGDMEMS